MTAVRKFMFCIVPGWFTSISFRGFKERFQYLKNSFIYLNWMKRHSTEADYINNEKLEPIDTFHHLYANTAKWRAFKVLHLVALQATVTVPFVPASVPAGAQWCGQHVNRRIDGLIEALPVDPSGKLSDQNWSHPLEAQLLVNTQEFDLHQPLLPVVQDLSICFETLAGKWLHVSSEEMP